LVGSGIGQSAGLGDVQQRARSAWLQAVDAAVAKNPSTVAVVNIADLIAPGGLLDRLQARGYVITEPVYVP
jgi:hypothetical protein